MTKNILLGLAAVPSCTYTGVDEVPVSLKMYLPLNSLHNHTATATQDWADRALLPYARSHIMALLRTTSKRELRAIEGMRCVAAAAAAVTQRGWGTYESPAPHTKYVPATCQQKHRQAPAQRIAHAAVRRALQRSWSRATRACRRRRPPAAAVPVTLLSAAAAARQLCVHKTSTHTQD